MTVLRSKLDDVDAPAVLAAWPKAKQVIQILTRACPKLQQSVDEFWCAQTHHLQYFGNSTQACQQQYVTELAQMQQGLPTLLELSMQAREVCSVPLLDELGPQAAIAMTVQLLLCHHQPSADVKQLLSDTLQHGCHELMDNNCWHAQSEQNQPQQLQSHQHQGLTQHVVLLWSTALACLQVSPYTKDMRHQKQLCAASVCTLYIAGAVVHLDTPPQRLTPHQLITHLHSTTCVHAMTKLSTLACTCHLQQCLPYASGITKLSIHHHHHHHHHDNYHHRHAKVLAC